ncbi:MAG: glycine/betaine ABC transporter substrate-binding protein [Micrococcales bacterium]|nr:glycine/betaine ABC transporter substrate-binding protein [Micrococcales bacterium]
MKRRPVLLTALAALSLLVAACGAPGSGGGQTQPAAADGTGTVCTPVKGDRLTVLVDDRQLQNSDNVVAAFNQEFATAHPAAIEALNTVAETLTTTLLIELNKAVDIDHKTSSEVAAEFVKDHDLAVSDSSQGAGVTVVVGAANFSENATLAEIYALVLRSAGYTTSTQTIGNRETYLPALTSGSIQVVPEYAASLADFLNAKADGADAEPVSTPDIGETMAALASLATAQGLTMGKASAAQDQNAFAVTTAFAEKHGVSTLSELAEACGGGVVLAGPPECPQRPFCQIGLEQTYGLRVSQFKPYDFALITQAVRHGDATVGLVLSSDGSLAAG